ncbi:Aminopeptidase Y [Coniothyrium glycines]
MELNNFEVLSFWLCSMLSGIIVTFWTTTGFVTDRELLLIVALFAIVASSVVSTSSASRASRAFLSQHAGAVHEKQIEDLREAHRRHVAALKYEHQTLIRELQSSLDAANAKFDRVHRDYDWMSGMYQDKIRSAQEQEDRITYLEGKLQEFGQLTPAMHVPFSAPPSKVTFSVPPRRRLPEPWKWAPHCPSPLSQVVEPEAE